ncbi:hypothetical protein [Sphingomonas sp. CROZ-RG-20F-R02-07]|uniref:hypothetical protein n=1 Tax=Sphingomonas sp. CROZ-RG-20F-R02-07 TaxID=2914832 RepID=UPI001F59F058|nr:hypothetical protein [Sphingomonas sp. CROZ-RG-20F-R02-07]
MSHFLATAAEIVGGVALIATGVGAAGSIGLFGAGFAGSSIATTIATIAKVASFAAAALAAGSALTAKRLSSASPDAWAADPNAGMDIVFGEACNSGHIVYRQAYDDKNKYQTEVTHWSIGPVHSIDQLYVDNIARDVVGTVVDMPDKGKFHEARQLGLCPEPSYLTVGPRDPWHWDASCKLSGKAAIITTFEYDSKSSTTFTSIPTCGWRGKGVLCYQPRKDGTYPGGVGAHRSDDETTWEWSDNPYDVGLTWCLGWRQNGKLVAGAGLPIAGIVVADFVEGANVADANGWKVGGTRSTSDDHWDVLKDILQAGGGQPLRLGALLGCVVNAPRVSLATIGRDDLAQGDISIVAMAARRDRINAVAPRYRAELLTNVTATVNGQVRLYTASTWADVSAPPIVVDDYVTADGRQRRKEVQYPLVQCFAGEQPTQVAQLARYDIEDAREFGPITLPLKIRWMGYKPGDVVTVNLPEVGLFHQDVMILSRTLEASTGVVTITARSETAAKHAFALGQTTTPPPAPSLPANAWAFEVPGLAAVEGEIDALSATVATQAEIVAGQGEDISTVDKRTRNYDGQVQLQ